MDLDMVEKCRICYTSKCHIGTLSKVERSEDERIGTLSKVERSEDEREET